MGNIVATLGEGGMRLEKLKKIGECFRVRLLSSIMKHGFTLSAKKTSATLHPQKLFRKQNRKRRDVQQILYYFLKRGLLKRRDQVVMTSY